MHPRQKLPSKDICDVQWRVVCGGVLRDLFSTHNRPCSAGRRAPEAVSVLFGCIVSKRCVKVAKLLVWLLERIKRPAEGSGEWIRTKCCWGWRGWATCWSSTTTPATTESTYLSQAFHRRSSAVTPEIVGQAHSHDDKWVAFALCSCETSAEAEPPSLRL